MFVHWADNFLQVYSIFSTPLLSMYKWTIKLQYEAKTGLFSVNSVIAQWEFMELDIELLHTTIIKKFNPEVFLDSCPGSSVLTTFIITTSALDAGSSVCVEAATIQLQLLFEKNKTETRN